MHGPHSSQLVNCYVLCTVCVDCVVLGIVCVQMCTVLLPPGVYPIAVTKYIKYRIRKVAACEDKSAVNCHAGLRTAFPCSTVLLVHLAMLL